MPEELCVMKVPGRKLPALTICKAGNNQHKVLATFKSVEAANIFIECCNVGIKSENYKPQAGPR